MCDTAAAVGNDAAISFDMATEYLKLAKKVQSEGACLLPEVRLFLDRHPAFWRKVGDVTASARRGIADLVTKGDLAWQETMLRETAELTNELMGSGTTSSLERLLAAQVATCRLAASEAELTAANQLDKATPARAEWLDRRRDRAALRYERSLKLLATVHKLLMPSPRPIEIASRMGGTKKSSTRARKRIELPIEAPEIVAN